MSQYPQPPYPQQPPASYPYPPQYPVPYQGPTLPPYGGPPDRLPHEWSAAGRRAAVLMFVLGGLLLLFGGCDALRSVVVSDAAFHAQIAEQQSLMGANAPAAPNVPVWVYRAVGGLIGLAVLGFGVTFVAAAGGVRRGRRRTTIVAVVATAVLLAVVGLIVVVSALSALITPLALAFACVFAVPLALATLQLVWLIQATRATSRFAAAHQAYAAQYAMYQQPAQAYGYGAGYGYGGGYGQPPPPPPSDGSAPTSP